MIIDAPWCGVKIISSFEGGAYKEVGRLPFYGPGTGIFCRGSSSMLSKYLLVCPFSFRIWCARRESKIPVDTLRFDLHCRDCKGQFKPQSTVDNAVSWQRSVTLVANPETAPNPDSIFFNHSQGLLWVKQPWEKWTKLSPNTEVI